MRHNRTSGFPSRVLATGVGLSLVLTTSSCTGGDNDPANAGATPADAENATSVAILGAELPVDTYPDVSGPLEATCPYLDGVVVESLTGERWTGTSLDSRFDPPACVFWSYAQVPQAVVSVRRMTTHQGAVDVVNWAAPVETTTKALQPVGWSGGRGGTSDSEYGVSGGGAVYSVFRQNVAVSVWTTQDQSVKAQQITEQSIANLGL